MVKANFVGLALLLIFGFMVVITGTGELYAGGEEETFESGEEEVVVTSEKKRHKIVFFVLGFLAAAFLIAL